MLIRAALLNSSSEWILDTSRHITSNSNVHHCISEVCTSCITSIAQNMKCFLYRGSKNKNRTSRRKVLSNFQGCILQRLKEEPLSRMKDGRFTACLHLRSGCELKSNAHTLLIEFLNGHVIAFIENPSWRYPPVRPPPRDK